MKLLHKTNIFSSLVTIILLLTGVLIVYFTVINKIDKEQDEHLLNDKNAIVGMLRQGKHFQHFNSNIGERIHVKPVNGIADTQNHFRDFSILDQDGDEDAGDEVVTYRELRFQVLVNEQAYEVTIARSLAEGIEISESLASSIFVFLFFALLVLFLVNSLISKSIFRPFYQTMDRIRNWSVQSGKPPRFIPTNINEFAELNSTVKGFMEKIVEDYSSLKEFTENISHETQTPVAIISGKLELLMQDNKIAPENQPLLMEAYAATQRLKRLNQSLVALTRIENKQYATKQRILLDDMIRDHLENFQDIFQESSIQVRTDLVPVMVLANEDLLKMLLNNLIINSIKHNGDQNKFILIELNKKGLVISNSGAAGPIPKEDVFSRFKRFKTSEDSLGLGLSIIKKVCDFLAWEIRYEFSAPNVHRFILTW